MSNINFQALVKQVRDYAEGSIPVKSATINAEAVIQNSLYPKHQPWD